jgi:hypothetical protein
MLKVVQVSGEQVLYVQEGYGGRDAVAVIFPIRRKGAADDVLCTSFLQVRSFRWYDIFSSSS